MRAAAFLLPALLLAACSNPTPTLVQPARPGDAQRTNPQVAQACREETARRIQRQDRGQLMREEERASRLGSETMGFGPSMVTDQMGRSFQFDRQVQECIRLNTQQSMPGARPADAATDTPAPPPPPPARRRSGS
ncbi:hypothetical protein [Roseococcus sp. YIM B11640]|uniref:hypothetical protein n=1 Tax=Roseococcus sp. YIM B11640 TaxID=3133973 RepID=UPI003C7C7394